MLQLFCNFDESKWNPYGFDISTSSSVTNYVLNEHEDVGQYGHMQYHLRWCHVTAILQFGESIWNLYWLIVLMGLSDSNYVPSEHEDVDQYDS